MSKWLTYLGVLLIGFLSNRCAIEDVKPPKQDVVIIASNCLVPEDSSLFNKLLRKEDISVIIQPMSFDSILKELKSTSYNQSFDAVILDNTYQLYDLSRKKLLHTLPEQIKTHPIRLRSPKNDWIIFGFDPYVLNFGDSLTHSITYNELTYGNPWKAELNYEHAASFYASVLYQFGMNDRNKASNWLIKMRSRMNVQDSLPLADYSLNRHSYCLQKKTHFVVPNQLRGGAFYDGVGIGIVRHSKNYQVLGILIEDLLQTSSNQLVTNKLNIYPIIDPEGGSRFDYQNNYPLLFRCSPNQSSRQFRDLNRMRRRLNI